MRKKDIVIVRAFPAPVAALWRAWTEPELIRRWWGPDRFTCPEASADFREGGRAVIGMRSPGDFGGGVLFNLWVYTKIVPLRRIEFVSNLCDKDGIKADPQNLGMPPEFPMDLRHVLAFEDLGKKGSRLSITEYGWIPGQMMHFAQMGMEQSLEKMAANIA